LQEELGVRKLLVASQKGGVGKTTTSMNLAAATAQIGTRVLLLDADPLSNISAALHLSEHPRRQSLRQLGIELPGALVADVVPNLDVLSPYDDGRCSDADLDHLLRALATPLVSRCYGCLLVDAPPFLGANPEQLIGSCEEMLLVMRVEATAYRTLPAFLELVQRSSRDGHTIPLRGILLTLPNGEDPGCRWERELRGRFGNRVLQEVIPHDETLVAAVGAGHIGSHVNPEAPASRQYHHLVSTLELSSAACPAVNAEQILEALREAGGCVAPVVAGEKETLSSVASPTENEDLLTAAAEPIKPATPTVHRIRRLNRAAENPRPVRPDRTPLPPTPPPTPLRRKTGGGKEKQSSDPDKQRATAPPSQAHTANALAQLWPLWILLGAVLGGGLRFVPLTNSLLPILVGAGVALLVVVVLSALAMQERTASRTRGHSRGRTRTRETKKSTGRLETRKETVASRLATLASNSKNPRRATDAE
jgi:chromosome partitioning protein